MNLYFRVAGINKNQRMCKVFADKYKAYESYHNMLIQNKLDIEKQIYYYWHFIKENVDVEVNTDNRSSNVRGGSSIYRKKGQPAIEHSQFSDLN